ncbi:integrase arm-type DNA-binding domain-containing protein, partial [Vibrio vulnificus]|uniref:integrase arm-type DNA-binding domain-containing protein n=4 Tax=Vibrio vulnificus TaxID=672 RepID=UPI001F4E35BB
MAKRVVPLTNTQVKQAKESDKEYTLSDGDGLQLRVKTNGTKLWILKYTHPITKKRNNISFGSFPDVSLAEARKRRSDAYFGAFRSVISGLSDHPFRFKPITDSAI